MLGALTAAIPAVGGAVLGASTGLMSTAASAGSGLLPVLGGALSGLGSLGAGIAGLFGSGYAANRSASAAGAANKYSIQMQREANYANAMMAQRQMDFQERMSSTSYQRAVSDLRKAGLNPILAALHSGATTPAGAMAQMQAARVIPEDGSQYIMQGAGIAANALQNVGGSVLQGLRSAADTLKTIEEIGLTKKQSGQVEAAKNKLIAEIDQVASQTSKNYADAVYTNATTRQVDYLIKKIAVETEKLKVDKSLSETQRQKLQQDIVESKKRLELIGAQTIHYLDAKRHGPAMNAAYSIATEAGTGLINMFQSLEKRMQEIDQKIFDFGKGIKWRE